MRTYSTLSWLLIGSLSAAACGELSSVDEDAELHDEEVGTAGLRKLGNVTPATQELITFQLSTTSTGPVLVGQLFDKTTETFKLRYYAFRDNAWRPVADIDSGAFTVLGLHVDAADRAHILYASNVLGGNDGPQTSVLRFATVSDRTVTKETIASFPYDGDTEDPPIKGGSLTFDAMGQPQVVFAERSNIRFARRASARWSSSATTLPAAEFSVAAATDGAGVVHAAYWASLDDSHSSLIYATNASGTFKVKQLRTVLGFPSDVDLVIANGRPHIGLSGLDEEDGTGGTLLVREEGGSLVDLPALPATNKAVKLDLDLLGERLVVGTSTVFDESAALAILRNGAWSSVPLVAAPAGDISITTRAGVVHAVTREGLFDSPFNAYYQLR